MTVAGNNAAITAIRQTSHDILLPLRCTDTDSYATLLRVPNREEPPQLKVKCIRFRHIVDIYVRLARGDVILCTFLFRRLNIL